MNKLLVISFTLLLAVAAVMAAPASAKDDHRDRGHSQSDRGDHRSDSNNRHSDRGNDRDRGNRYNHDNRRYWAQHRYHSRIRYDAPRGYLYRRWNIGARLPYGYYGRNYYVDYRSYGLAPPPRGYMWVRVAGDVYLVRIRNGMVRDIRFNLFF